MKRIDHRILLAAVTLGGFALRIVRLDFQPLWWDEGYSMFFATRDFGAMLERTAIDIHPPLYYALLQLWMTFAGKSEIAVRLLSVAIGVAAIPLIYALARKLFAEPRVALIAALLLALSPLHIYYSQEVRMYGLVTLLGLASVCLFVQLLEMPPGKPKTAVVVAAYIGITAAALYTQYYAAFIVAFEILFFVVLFVRRSPLAPRRSFVHWLGAWLAIAALYLPWIVYAGGKLYVYVASKVAIEKYPPLDPLAFLAQHFAAFSIGHLTDWTWLAWGSAAFVTLALFGAVVEMRKRENARTERKGLPHSHTLTLFYLLIPLALGYIVNLVYPFHPIRNERLLLIAAPAFLIFVALGINAFWNRRAMFGTFALMIIAALSVASLYDFYTAPRYPNDDYRPLIAEMQALAQPGDTFLAIYPWQIGYLETDYTGAPLTVVETPSDAWINNPAQMQRDLDALTAKRSRVWLPALQTQGRILEDALDANLRSRTYSVVDDWFGTTRLELFQAIDDPPRADRVLPIASAFLNAWGISEQSVVAGQDVIPIWFDWGRAPEPDFKLSLRLVDAGGNVWAQDDRGIEPGVQRIGFAVPAGTPPGDYDLRLTLYRDHASRSAAQSESLAHVRVIAPAQPNLAAVPHRVNVDFGNGIRLVGYDALPIFRPGFPTPITLFWQATRALDGNYTVVLQAQTDRDIYDRIQTEPTRGIYPTTRWQPDELIRDPQTIMLRADAPDANYNLVATLFDPAKPSPSQTRVIGTISVNGRPHYFGAPAPSMPLAARLGNLARLVGYDLLSDSRSVRLVLYWQALALTPTAYTVFVHAVHANGNTVAYGDQIPGNGALPTTSWVKDEFLADLYEFSIPPGAPPGEYQIQVGMYDPKTGTRLFVFDASNQNVGDYIQLSTRITVK